MILTYDIIIWEQSYVEELKACGDIAMDRSRISSDNIEAHAYLFMK